MPVYVAFLRGVNVAGHRKVKMAELAAVHEALGHGEVATYLQSGNVVFTSPEKSRSKLAAALLAAYQKQLKLETELLLRTATDLARIVEKCPLQLSGEREPKFLHAVLLSKAPTKTEIKNIATFQGPEEWQVVRDTLYIYYTAGSGRSKLTLPYLERKLALTATGRNWNTITALSALAAERQ